MYVYIYIYMYGAVVSDGGGCNNCNNTTANQAYRPGELGLGLGRPFPSSLLCPGFAAKVFKDYIDAALSAPRAPERLRVRSI